MTLRPLSLAVTLAVLSACSNTNTTTISGTAASAGNSNGKQNLPSANMAHYRGQLVATDGGYYFTPCNGAQSMFVAADNQLDQLVQQRTQGNAINLYAELYGSLVVPPASGVGSNRLSALQLQDVLLLSAQDANFSCQNSNDFLLRAFGNTPAWQAVVYGQTLNLTIAASSQNYQVDSSQFDGMYQQHIRAQALLDEQRLDLEISPNDCVDKQNNYFAYSASVREPYQQYQGCAQMGNSNGFASLIGKYHGEARAASSPTHKLDLQLAGDNSVQLVHDYQNGEAPIIEKGFWQLTNNAEVWVTLTQREGKGRYPQPPSMLLKRTSSGLAGVAYFDSNGNAKYGSEGLTLAKTSSGTVTVINPPAAKPAVAAPAQATDNAVSASSSETPRLDIPVQVGVSQGVHAAVNDYFVMHRTNPGNSKYRYALADLNQDGVDEALVMLDWCSASGCVMLVFEGLGGDRYRFISRIEQTGSPVYLGEANHYGWKDLITHRNGGSWHNLSFNGLAYPDSSNKGPAATPSQTQVFSGNWQQQPAHRVK